MLASEARKKLEEVKAFKTVERFFPYIEKAIKDGLDFIEIYIHNCTQGEINLLSKHYGYKLEPIYDDSGDYHRSDKKIGYRVCW